MFGRAMSITENLRTVNQRIHQACERAGRDPLDVTLLAVSKTWPVEAVKELAEADHLRFGENRVQEGAEKIPLLPDTLEWHLIGPLQKNKVRKALKLFSHIHSVDSLAIAEVINRVAEEEQVRPQVFLQVNVADEPQKYGFSKDELRHSLPKLEKLPAIVVVGLMLIPPYHDDPEQERIYYRQLREFRDIIQADTRLNLRQLSMGMSHDFEVAIEEGATFVRVGSAIFGDRPSFE